MIQKSRPEPVVNSSLALRELCQRLQGIDTWDVLELGPVRQRNIEFWSAYCNSIYVADLRSSLPLPPVEDPELPGPEWDQLLPLPEGRHFDVILVWDLLNYLELPAVSDLALHLARFSRKGTILFMLIFDSKDMPEEATIYRIVDEEHLRYEFASAERRACPRHHPRALAGAMPQFQTSSSFRLRNGIVEYLFVCEGKTG
jgi:hypothetical protein